MKRTIIGLLAVTGLVLTLLPSILVFMGNISGQTQKLLMLVGMVLWFAIAPFWIKKQEEPV